MSTESIAWPIPEAEPRPLVEQLHEWVITVDHKRLGILYILYAVVFLLVGGVEATIMRIQLARPHNDFVSPQVFNRMFTMHGTTMIFFVAMPILFGFANYFTLRLFRRKIYRDHYESPADPRVTPGKAELIR